ncbi:MAG: hypothetical protein ACREQN_05065 [Candidatus Binataceae bacterium]
MAEIIQLRERQEARRREQRRLAQQHNLEQAVAVLRQNLAAVAAQLRDAPAAAQPELLERVEKLAALIRYGMRMVGREFAEAIPGEAR